MDQNEKNTVPNEVVPIDEIIGDRETTTPSTGAPTEATKDPKLDKLSSSAPKPSEILRGDLSLKSAPKPSEMLGNKPVATPPVGKRAIITRPNKIGMYFGIGFGVLAVCAAVFFIFFFKVTITINPDPAPDTILLDGKQIKAGTYKIYPGNHSIEFDKNGYISYKNERNFSVSEKVTLDMKLEPAKDATLLSQGGSMPVATKDGNYIIFLNTAGQIFSKKLTVADSVPVALSNGSFQNVTDLMISNDGSFSLVKDSEAIKLVDFSKTNVLDQIQATLPPMVSAVHAVTWNSTKNSYFPEENYKIIYDLDTVSGWRVFLTNRTHTQTDTLANIDRNNFKSLYLDWGESDKQVWLAGGEAGIIDLATREYQTVSREANFVFAKWGPNAQYAALLDDQGTLYRYKDGKLEKTNFKTQANKLTFTSANKLVIVTGGRPIEVNFDTLGSIDYAEVKGLENAKRATVAHDAIFFDDSQGVKSANLSFSSYSQK